MPSGFTVTTIYGPIIYIGQYALWSILTNFWWLWPRHLRPPPSIALSLLQRVSIACYAERCISYSKSVRLSVCLSVRHTLALSQNDSNGSSLEDSPMTLVSSRLTSPQNSKANMGSEGAE